MFPAPAAFFQQALARTSACLESGQSAELVHLPPSGRGLAIALLANQPRFAARGDLFVVVVDSYTRGEALREAILACWPERTTATRQVRFFPHWDTLPYDAFSPQQQVQAQRIETLYALQQRSGPGATASRVVVVSAPALLQGVIPPAAIQKHALPLQVGMPLPSMAVLQQDLVTQGYLRVEVVEGPGEFASRGDILDVFPPSWERPLRLECFDDELEALFHFDVSSQRNVGALEEALVLPASEALLSAAGWQRFRQALAEKRGSIQPALYRNLVSYLEQQAPFPGFEQYLPLWHGEAAWLLEVLASPPRPAEGETSTVHWLLEEPEPLRAQMEQFAAEVEREYAAALEQGQLALEPARYYRTEAWAWRQLQKTHPLALQTLHIESGSGGTTVVPWPIRRNELPHVLPQTIPEAERNGVSSPRSPSPRSRFALWVERMEALLQDGVPVLVAAQSETAARRLQQLFEKEAALPEDVPLLATTVEATGEEPATGTSPPQSEPLLAWMAENQRNRTPHGRLAIGVSALQEGFHCVDEQGRVVFQLLTEADLFEGHKPAIRRPSKGQLRSFLAALGELKPGDAVVHAEYGVGRYQGLQQVAKGSGKSEFLVIAYAGGDKVYVPVHHFHLVNKYASQGKAAPLNKLGDGRWQRTRSRVKRAVEGLAEEMVALQAARHEDEGHACATATEEINAFEETFEFVETEDQLTAIQDVLNDMRQPRPMDRLVCGDVGFGKTEVALRAAFFAVADGRQVLLLAPTTVLAQQHFQTFQRRLESFAVQVDVVSRLRSPKEQREVLKRFAAGQVDVLIGTHRLLSKDVKPQQLGLLVVDEEQRFGVVHKERIKKIRAQVDVLTLSATPIPRTLHLALSGLRDLSLIETPPIDRHAIRTRLVRMTDYIIREAVEREMRRGGQIFFVHNRVESIYARAAALQELLPRVRIGVAHGQLGERELEQVMLDFVRGESDLLLCTTIIESGLDIPRANTIIVSDAHRFGLAQLYQLRGRVGRSHVQAYAFLLVPPHELLGEQAEKRLQILRDIHELGAGFRIGMHDLELRGAGNLLGAEQSGHIAEVGLELFTTMVEEAVAKRRRERSASQAAREAAGLALQEVRVDLGFSYVLPENYITGTRARLDVYKRLAGVESEGALWQLRQSLEERFGPLPADADALFLLMQARLLARQSGIRGIEAVDGQLHLRCAEEHRLDVGRLLERTADPSDALQLLPDGSLRLGEVPADPAMLLRQLGRLTQLPPPLTPPPPN